MGLIANRLAQVQEKENQLNQFVASRLDQFKGKASPIYEVKFQGYAAQEQNKFVKDVADTQFGGNVNRAWRAIWKDPALRSKWEEINNNLEAIGTANKFTVGQALTLRSKLNSDKWWVSDNDKKHLKTLLDGAMDFGNDMPLQQRAEAIHNFEWALSTNEYFNKNVIPTLRYAIKGVEKDYTTADVEGRKFLRRTLEEKVDDIRKNAIKRLAENHQLIESDPGYKEIEEYVNASIGQAKKEIWTKLDEDASRGRGDGGGGDGGRSTGGYVVQFSPENPFAEQGGKWSERSLMQTLRNAGAVIPQGGRAVGNQQPFKLDALSFNQYFSGGTRILQPTTIQGQAVIPVGVARDVDGRLYLYGKRSRYSGAQAQQDELGSLFNADGTANMTVFNNLPDVAFGYGDAQSQIAAMTGYANPQEINRAIDAGKDGRPLPSGSARIRTYAIQGAYQGGGGGVAPAAAAPAPAAGTAPAGTAPAAAAATTAAATPAPGSPEDPTMSLLRQAYPTVAWNEQYGYHYFDPEQNAIFQIAVKDSASQPAAAPQANAAPAPVPAPAASTTTTPAATTPAVSATASAPAPATESTTAAAPDEAESFMLNGKRVDIGEAYSFTGEGEIINPQGYKKKGWFRDGELQGQGEVTWPDGKKWKGEFKNGYPAIGWDKASEEAEKPKEQSGADQYAGMVDQVGTTLQPGTYRSEGETPEEMSKRQGVTTEAPQAVTSSAPALPKPTGPTADDGPSRKIEYEDGGVYKGSWKGNKRIGRGTYRTEKNAPNGYEYEGVYKDDKPNGYGEMTKYVSTIKDKEVEFTYKGQFENGEFSRGLYEWQSGDNKGSSYDGQFKDNKMEGTGAYKWPDGKKWRGKFKDGAPVIGWEEAYNKAR
jgi:hypothetical protein